MNALTEERMLTAWEHGCTLPECSRALALLASALAPSDALAPSGPSALAPGDVESPAHSDVAALAELPLARRNALLLELHIVSFGGEIEAFAACPRCAAQFELRMSAHGLLPGPGAERETWLEAGRERSMRAATTADLAAIAHVHDAEEASRRLLARTMELPLAEIAAASVPHWSERFERINAPAELRCLWRCEACGLDAPLDFDVAAFLWRKVTARVRWLLEEVHRLAAAYGWSEAAILAMTPMRRAAYLEMLDA